MTIPTIHMNGTSKGSLIEALCKASHALNDAYKALRATAPNGRDYYQQGPEAMKAAVAEHHARLRKLDEVKGEVDSMAQAIDGL